MKDVNLISLCGRHPLGVENYQIIHGDLSYADSLKITDCSSGIVTVAELHGGREDCLDINNACHDITVQVGQWFPAGKFVATVKGASSNITLRGTLRGHGTETDIDLGNHSDQQSGRTVDVKLDLITLDGSPVRVRVLHAHRPTILNPEQPYIISTFAKGWFSTVWDKLKRIAAFFKIDL